MKSKEMENNKRFKAFAIIFALITLVFLVMFVFTLTNASSYKSYKKIAKRGLTIEGNKLWTLSEGEYYIFIYSSDSTNTKINRTKQSDLEVYIVNYFDFYKENEKEHGDSICPIRLMDVDQTENKRCLGSSTTTSATSWTNFTVREQDLPILINMSVSSSNYSYSVYTTEMQIKQELQSTIGLVSVAYTPIFKKEEDF